MSGHDKTESAVTLGRNTHQWLTEHGNFVVLNNGIEFAATYFVMLLVLFFYGSGRYLGIDYWINRRWGHCV